MKKISGMFRIISLVALLFSILLWCAIGCCIRDTAENYFVKNGESLELSRYVKTHIDEKATQVSTKNASYKAELKLFGVFPIKTVEIKKTERKTVVPGGIPFGVKMLSDGALVTAFSAINNNGKVLSPAKDAGIEIGDMIVSVGGVSVTSNSEVIRLVNKSRGKDIRVGVKRKNNNVEQLKVTPILDKSDMCYKIGVMIRDSSAGIGTITYYDPNTQTFAGLGHAVCDASTLAPLSLLDGKVVIAEIDGVTPGKSGTPGSLNGHFASHYSQGSITKNDQTGVYGKLTGVKVSGEPMEVAFKQEIQTGKATILTTISGMTAKQYDIEIEMISQNTERSTKNMLIRVTDKELLKKTGGIVQGMSGSPIIQNGRLVGAVTHVLVDDPTRGYAIFAENMLSAAQSPTPQPQKAS